MRSIFFLVILLASTCATVELTGQVKAFVQKLLNKVTTPKFFTVTDKLICDVGNDTATWAAQNCALSELIDNMSAKGSSYQNTLITTKASLANYLFTFIQCLSDCKDNGLTDFIKGTIGFALSNTLTKPYNTCVTQKVPAMISAGKTILQRQEQCSKCGVAAMTDDLITKVVKTTMQRTFVNTWTKCVRPLITCGMLNITQYIPTAGPEKTCLATGPSKLWT